MLPELLNNGYKVIYLYRDPRDMLISSKNRFANYNMYLYLYMWKRSINQVLQLNSNPNLMLLSFEDLIQKKAGTLSALDKFLGVELDYQIKSLTRHNKEKAYTSNSSFGDVKSVFDSKVLFRWKSQPDADEVLLVNAFSRKELGQLGYTYKVPKFSLKLIKFSVNYILQVVKARLLIYARQSIKV